MEREKEIQAILGQYERQLVEKDAQIVGLQADISTKQAQIDRLQSEKQVQCTEIDQLSGRLRSLELQGVRTQPPPPPMVPSSITFNWRSCKNKPYGQEIHGKPVVHNGKVYVRRQIGRPQTVLEYTPGRDQWNELPPRPPLNYVDNFTIATLRGDLVVVGGNIKYEATNTIFRWDSQQWLQSYPVMPTARYGPTVVEYQNHLIVAGGLITEKTRIPDVNILDTTNKWLTAESLPNTDDYYRSVLIDDTVYLVGQDTKTVLRAHAPSLISQATSGTSSHHVWESLPNAPFYHSTPVTIGNALLTVGGTICDNFTASIQLYNPTNNQWTKVGDLPEPMYWCNCTVLSGELVVLGGRGRSLFNVTPSVSVASLNYSNTI